jgi:hypothetical protein
VHTHTIKIEAIVVKHDILELIHESKKLMMIFLSYEAFTETPVYSLSVDGFSCVNLDHLSSP